MLLKEVKIKLFMKTTLVLSLLTFCAASAFSQDASAQESLTNTIAPKYSNEFLAIGVGADALGLGNAVTAQTGGVMSGYWNPAGLTKVDRWLEAGAMHAEYFAGIAKYDYIGLAHSIDEKSSVGFTAIRFAVDDIPNTTQLIDNNGNIDYDRISTFTAADYGFIFSYARKMPIEGLSVGGNVKVIHRRVGDFARSWGFGLDAGAQYESKKEWKFGAVLRDATSTFNAWMFTLNNETKEVFLNTGNALPENGLELTLPRLILGAYKKYEIGEKGLYAAGELDLTVTTDGARNTLLSSGLVSADPHLGLSFGFKNYVSLRAGLSNMQYVTDFDDSRSLNVQPNLGIGLNIKNFYLDYAFTDIGDASVALYSHIISLRIKLDKPNNATR
ncbi:MAG: PorV/PorQ family protein [Crocinitomicaceae bacterium]